MASFEFRRFLGEALQAEREAADLRRSQLTGPTGKDQTTIWRWETGQNWPEDPDAVVDVYTQLGGSEPLDLWRDAFRRAEENGARKKGPAAEDAESGEPGGERPPRDLLGPDDDEAQSEPA